MFLTGIIEVIDITNNMSYKNVASGVGYKLLSSRVRKTGDDAEA